jgi:hypothetical protein
MTLVLNVACRVKKFCTLPKGCESVTLLLTAYLPQGKTYENYDFADTETAKFVSRVRDYCIFKKYAFCQGRTVDLISFSVLPIVA